MLMPTTHQHRLFPKEKAIQVAADMQAGEDEGWTYAPVHCPKGTGHSYIEIYDEDGFLVGRVC